MPVRWFLIAFAVLASLATLAVFIVAVTSNDAGRQGFAVVAPDTTIVAVQPQSAAAGAGIRVGDVLALDRMSLIDVMSVYDLREKGTGRDLHVVVRRDGTLIASRVRPRPFFSDRSLAVLAGLTVLENVFVAGLVVLVLARSPSSTAVALWAFAFPWTFASYAVGYHTPTWFALIGVAANDFLGNALGTAGAIVLTLHAVLSAQRRAGYERLAVLVGVIVGAIALGSDAYLVVVRNAPPPVLIMADHGIAFVGPVIVGAMLVVAFTRSSGLARVRLRWLTVGLGAIGLQSALNPIITSIPGSVYTIWPTCIQLVLTLAGFGTLAFAIARSELFDVGFVVNRTAIFAATTALLVAVFAGLNWFVGLALKSTGLALPVEVLIAGSLGLSLNLIHRRIDRAIDLLFFRKRYDAQRRLRRVARGLVHATEQAVVAETLVAEVCESLELHSGALFLAGEDGVQRRIFASGWPPDTALELAPNDRSLVHLAGVTDGVRLDGIPHDAPFPHGHPRPRLAFPLWSRGKLIGVALFSAHKSGAVLDPEETEAVERLIVAAVTAFDRVDAEALRRALDEVYALRQEREVLLRRLDSALTGAPG
jgi:hypothetical protein